MTDIQFAKEHMGEYFWHRDYLVRVIGYDVTGVGACVIIDYPAGWGLDMVVPSDVINVSLCETGKGHYINWEELKCL